MSKPGKGRPGSVMSVVVHHCHCSDLMRGGNSENISHRNRNDDSKAFGSAESEKLFRPRSETVKLYDGNDLIRAKIIGLVFGLTITVVVLGILSVMGLTIFGLPTEDTIKFLTSLTSPLLAIVTFIAGYLFRGRRRKNR
jgi:hypothetical protein